MRRLVGLLLAVAVLAAGLWLWYYFTSPERQIKSALNTLVEAAQVGAEDGNLARAARARELAEGFTIAATLEWQEVESILTDQVAGRAELQNLFLAALTSPAAVASEVTGVEVNAERRGRSGHAQFNFWSTIYSPEQSVSHWRVETDWLKTEAGWQINFARAVQEL